MSVIEREGLQTEVTTRDVLHRAADLLEEFGWCQGTLGSLEKGKFCLLGAVYQAQDDLGALQSKLPYRSYGTHYAHIVGCDYAWNDQPGRTKAEVVARLREAAERA